MKGQVPRLKHHLIKKTVSDCISATDTALSFVFRSVGGIRVSMYNAVKLDDVKTLVDFMKDFRQQNRKQ